MSVELSEEVTKALASLCEKEKEIIGLVVFDENGSVILNRYPQSVPAEQLKYCINYLFVLIYDNE